VPNPNPLYPSGTRLVDGAEVFTGPVTFNGAETHTGAETHSGAVAFTGTNTMPAISGTTLIGGANAAYALSPVDPAASGLKAWSFPNYLALGTASAVTVVGSVYLSEVHLTGGVTYSTLYVKLQANGGTANAGSNFAGLYNSAGTLVATTADLSGALGTNAGTTGYIACPLTAGYTPPSPGGKYWVAAQFSMANAGSFPAFYCLSNFVTVTTSAGTTATGVAAPAGTTPYPFTAIATAAATALPASFTLTNAGTTGAYAFWAGAA
jgi:hypothetical protein